MKAVIRAGGFGARLWPLSRQGNPKQLQAVVGEEAMLRVTFKRLRDFIEPADIFVSASQNLASTVQGLVPEIDKANFIWESSARNTGPAMALETAYLSFILPPETVVASVPADDYISDTEAFGALLKLSAEFIAEHGDYILTPAVRPTIVDSGYSYFKVGTQLAVQGEEAIYRVAEVVEKPNEERCRELVDSGLYYAHTGMYIWRLGYAAELWQKFQPALWSLCQETVVLMRADKPDWEKISQVYGQAEKMSVETALTNKAPQIAMSVSDRIGWSDLGKWHIIKRMLSAEGENLIKGQIVVNESKNNLLYNLAGAKKIMVINEADDLVVVDTPDALFISRLDKSAGVKECLDKIKAEGWEEYL